MEALLNCCAEFRLAGVTPLGDLVVLDLLEHGLDLIQLRTCHLEIEPATDEHADFPDAPAVLAAAHSVAAWLRASEAEAYAAVSATLIDLYNDNWSEGPPITAEEFARRIELVAVCVPSYGERFTLWFSDGAEELFGGHAIYASFGADRRFRNAHLVG